MDNKERAFQKRLLETFRQEALEHVQNISARLVEWEETRDPAAHAALLETIFREAHSLKGAARAVNLMEVESVCQAMENVLAALRRRELTPSPELFDLFHSTVETVSALTAEDNPNGHPEPDTADLIRRLQSALLSGSRPATGNRSVPVPPITPPRAPEPVTEPPASEPSVPLLAPAPPAPVAPARTAAEPLALPATVRVDPARLDALLLQSEELLTSKGTAAAHTAELRELLATLNEWKAEWRRLAPALRHLQRAQQISINDKAALASGKLYDFLTWNSEFIQTLSGRLTATTRQAEQEQRNLGTKIDSLLDDARRVSMLPFSSLLEPIPGFVRQLARAQGKEVE